MAQRIRRAQATQAEEAASLDELRGFLKAHPFDSDPRPSTLGSFIGSLAAMGKRHERLQSALAALQV